MERWENGCICSCSYRCRCLCRCLCFCFSLVFVVLKPMPIRRLPRRPFEKLLLQHNCKDKGKAGQGAGGRGRAGLGVFGFPLPYLRVHLECETNQLPICCRSECSGLNSVAASLIWTALQPDASTARPLDASASAIESKRSKVMAMSCSCT